MKTQVLAFFFVLNAIPFALMAQNNNTAPNPPHVKLGRLDLWKGSDKSAADTTKFSQAQILENKTLTTVEPDYKITSFKFSIFSPAKGAKMEGGKIKGDYWGPFETKGNNLTGKEIDFIKQCSSANIFLEDITYEKNGKQGKCADLIYRYK